MAEQQQISAGHDSEEHDISSSTHLASSFELQSNINSVVHETHQLLIAAINIFVISQAVMKLLMCFQGVSECMNKTPSGLADFSMFVAVGVLQSWMVHNTRIKLVGFKTYTKAGFVVLEAYALLLLVNLRYIRTAMVPVIIIAFIFAVRGKFGKKIHLWYDHNNTQDSICSMEQMKILLASNSLQLFSVVLGLYKGQDDIFIMSHFLLFFSTAVSALGVLVSKLPVGVSPGVPYVLPIVQRTCIVALLVAIHTAAAEWLGEDIVLACMPELVSILAWFCIHYDHGGNSFSVHSLTSRKSEIIIVSSAAAILAYQRTSLSKSMYTRAFRISCSSSALSYVSGWMLHQWNGNFSDSMGLIQLLMFSAKNCLSTTAVLSIMPVGRWILHEPKFALYTITIVTVLLLIFLLKFGRKLSTLFVKALGVIALEEQPAGIDTNVHDGGSSYVGRPLKY